MKRYQFPTLVLLCLILLGTTALGASASTKGKQASQATPVTSPGRPVTLAAAAPQVVNMQKVPKETSAQAAANAQRHAPPLGTGVSPAVYAKRKAAAAYSQVAPRSGKAMTPPTKSGSAATQTPTPITQFQGMADSAATCSYSECSGPDQALAVSFSQVVQGVNASFAVYNLSGVLQPGWPKNAQSFFGVPDPGSCDPNGPFLAEPRAFYDQNFNRFWVAMLQYEGSPISDTCADSSILWIAVSQTGNANGAWNIYHFDMEVGGLGFWADFPEFGFDQQAIYFSANMFSFSDFSFQYAEYFGVNKFDMMNGKALAFSGFLDPTLNGVPLDTVQPTLGEALQVGGPLSGQFIASENIDFGGGQCVNGCNGVVVITMSNPTTSPSSTSLFFSTVGYSLAPFADQPGCTACLGTFDTRITGTPTWHNGLITFSLNTAFFNGTQFVPGIFWGQIAVQLNSDGSIAGASVLQQGYFFSVSDIAVMYGAMGTDGDGDVFMVYNFSGGIIKPGLAYAARRVTFPWGQFPDSGVILAPGAAPFSSGEVGLYNALSPSGVPFTNDVWLSGAYANANGDWSTEIAHSKFVKGQS